MELNGIKLEPGMVLTIRDISQLLFLLGIMMLLSYLIPMRIVGVLVHTEKQ